MTAVWVEMAVLWRKEGIALLRARAAKATEAARGSAGRYRDLCEASARAWSAAATAYEDAWAGVPEALAQPVKP